MEPGFYLLAPVLAVAALHLIVRSISLFHKKTKALPSAIRTSARKHSSWYMFFHCADLTGEKKTILNRSTGTISTSREKTQLSDSRPVQRRNLA